MRLKRGSSPDAPPLISIFVSGAALTWLFFLQKIMPVPGVRGNIDLFPELIYLAPRYGGPTRCFSIDPLPRALLFWLASQNVF